MRLNWTELNTTPQITNVAPHSLWFLKTLPLKIKTARGSQAARRSGGTAAAAKEPSWVDWDQEEKEQEETEQLVMVELSGILDSDLLSKCENKRKILGIDTERPILQVDNYVFAGEYEDTVGTCVIFEENVEYVDAEGSNKTVLK